MAITEEQRRAIAIANARMRMAEAGNAPEAAPAQAAPADTQGPMSWLNRGIAQGFDALAGTANAGANAVIRGGAGVLGIEDPYQFNATPTAGLMDVAGIQQAQGAPETLGQRALMGAGEAAGLMVPFGAAARGLAGAGGVAGGVGQAMQTRGIGGMGAELAAGAGAQVGGQVAADAAGGQYGDIARPFGELGGAALGALGPGAAGRAALSAADVTSRTLPGTSAIRNVIEREITPFTRRGAMEIARRRAQGLAQDPEAAARAIDPNSPLSPAQQTGDPNLMSLERGIIAQNPQMQQGFDARNLDAQRGLAGEAASGTAPVGEAQDFIRRRTEAVVGRLENRVQRAEQAAQERIARLEPNRPAAANSQIVREELDKAYSAAKADERALWNAIPQKAPVGTSSAKQELQAQLERATRVRTGAVPGAARRWLAAGDGPEANEISSALDAMIQPQGRFGAEVPADEMIALYSQLRQAARNARSGPTPNGFTSSAADAIADAILKDMDAASLGPQYAAARTYTARMREVFSQGTVGRARTRNTTGAESLDPSLTLDRTVGTGGTRGAVGLDDLRTAANFRSPVVQSFVDEPVTDYMRGQLARRGDFTPQRGEAFMRQNPEMMQRLPGLQSDVQGAVQAGQQAERVGQRYGQIAQGMQNPRQSPAAAFTQARPGEEVNRAVFQAQNPIAAARQVARQAARDQSGLASRGLKGGTLDYLMGRASSGFSPEGDRLISGDVLNGLLKDRQTRGALAQIYDSAELGRLDRIAGELQKLEMSRNAVPMAEILDVTPNRMIQYIGGVIAARSGAQLGAGTSGASLKTSSMAVGRFNSLLQSLTGDRAEAILRDAITDPVLFRDLMTPMNTPQRAKEVERRVSEWIQGYSAAALAGDEE